MNDWRETPHWKNMELKPLNLDEIPEVLRRFIYPEEQKNGVICAKTAFTVVLLLRWALSGPEYGHEYDFEGRKVFWKTHDRYGFRTSIILHSEQEEQWNDLADEMDTMQEASWIELGELHCRNGHGIIDRVIVNNCFPYGRNLEFDGKAGVTRLIEDAMVSSHHTGYQVIHYYDPKRTYSRREDDGWWYQLSFDVQCDSNNSSTAVSSIDVEGGLEDLI